MRGDKRLDWSVPAERVADMKQNDTRIYDIAVIPDKTSFSADGGNALLNMGDGTEPGMNAKRDKDTGSRDTGAKSGYPYANNDWSRAIIERNNTRGSVFSKLLQRPYTPGKTLFDPESQDFAKASSDQTIIHYYSADQNGDTVATGTQTRVTLSMAADRIEGVLSSDPVLGDEWDPTQQQWQGGLSVTRGGKPLDQGVDWNASYTYDDPRSGNAAWHDGVPADTDAKVRAIRVSFDRARFQSAADTGTVRVVFLTRVTVDAARGNVKSSDTMTGEFTTDQETARAEGDNFIWVIAPSEPAASIDTAVTVTDGTGTERADGAQPGDTAGYVIRPRLTNIQRSGTVVKPTITVPYPDGLLDPVMAGGPWKLTISGSGAGRTITFTYDSPDGTLIPELGVDGSVDLPAIEWRATVGNKAAGTISAAATQTTDIAQNGTVPAHPQVTSNTAVAQFIVDAKAGETGALNALTSKTDIGDSLSWRFNLYAKGSGRTGGADTIVRVPSNDDAIMAGDNNTGLDGSWREYDRGHSAYHGTWKLTEPVSVNAANSTATSILYSTSVAWTDEPDDYEWKTWEQLSDEDKSRITAIRVRSDFETGSDGNMPVAAADGTITLTPTDGTKDDRYVMWPGRTRFSDGHAMGNLPWADAVTATAGSISGTLWWDRNENTLIDAGEECIGGIEVSLWRADENGGRMGDAPLRTVNSDGDGRYEFDLLHAGNYRVQVKRSTGTSTGDGVQTSVTTYYSQDKPVAGTRSWNSRLKGQARDESDVIRLTVGADQQRVDFGYAKPDPKATLDKTQTRLSCTADSCEINWDVKVTNSGKTTDKIHIPPTISSGGANSRALDSSGHLWAWGYNDAERLGDGTPSTRHIPLAVTPDRTYTTVSAGTHHSLALDSSGHLWAWGYNRDGQLGDGTTTTERHTPVAVTPDRTYIAVSAGSYYSLALDRSGHLWAWGYNLFGQLGDGTTTRRHTPVAVTPDRTYIAVSAGSDHSLALDRSGHLWAWGYNSYGQLGDGTTTRRRAPVEITPDRTYAMASDASLESAGTGNLPADSVLSDRMSGIVENVRATAGTVSRTEDSYNTFKQVSSSSFHTLALDSSGHVWTWGSNSNGQLGDGTNTDRQTPADVTTVTQGVAVDPTAVPVDPVSETQDGGDVIRTYNPPYTIAPGGYIVFHFTGTVSRAQADRIVHNQAWFDSPDTPYVGTPHALRENTTTPFKPDDAKLDRSSHDITGNPSCRTGTDYRNPGMEHWFSNGNEDSCDQVGALIPAYTTEPVRGSISGMYWRDQNRDGIRQDTETDRIPGLSVILENQAGERISTTVTDRNGAYRFDKLPLGSYRIRFSRVPRADFTTPDANDANPVVDSSSTDSDAGTGEDYGMGTPLITLTETTPDRDHIDAGVLADKPWTGILPHTGLFVLPCLMILALAAMIASILLLRQPAAKERDSEKHGS